MSCDISSLSSQEIGQLDPHLLTGSEKTIALCSSDLEKLFAVIHQQIRFSFSVAHLACINKVVSTYLLI
jgi:hypothetical protein